MSKIHAKRNTSKSDLEGDLRAAATVKLTGSEPDDYRALKMCEQSNHNQIVVTDTEGPRRSIPSVVRTFAAVEGYLFKKKKTTTILTRYNPLMDYRRSLTKWLRDYIRICRHFRVFRAVRRVVTPATPHVICSYHFSDELYLQNMLWLNPSSKNLIRHAEKVKEGEWTFCDVRLIPEFVEKILPRIQNPFVLITGRWGLPTLSKSSYTDVLLSSEKVILWFSQNMIFENPKCHPLPYGVMHLRSHQILQEMKNTDGPREHKIFFGSVAAGLNHSAEIFSHLSPSILADRELMISRMDKQLPFKEYLRKIKNHRFIASPLGDRPETYRHWEAIALGCMPVSSVPAIYRSLYGPNMIYLEKMSDILELDPEKLDYTPPGQEIVTLDYWTRRIRQLVPPRDPRCPEGRPCARDGAPHSDLA